MVNPIPQNVRKIWDEWNIRGVILSSLCLQVILTLFAPLRKGTTNKLVMMQLWSVYLLADLAAVFALGLISNTKADTLADNTTLLAFWPPFLILHLGGPDNITAFALEDNELWLRHFVGLLVQAAVAVYIFLLSFPKTKLTVPTILMFVAASIKYLERTRAFYLSSFDGFQNSISEEPNPGIVPAINRWKIRAHAQAIRAAYLFSEAAKQTGESPVCSSPGLEKTGESPGLEQTGESPGLEKTGESPGLEKTSESPGLERLEKITELVKVVRDAFEDFKIFKGLIVNLLSNFRQHQESKKVFCELSPEVAYRRIEVELNFIYEILYTKVQVVFSLAGCVRRFITFGIVVAAFLIFHFEVNKHGFDEFDVAITYTLFWGAIALDIIALFILISFDLTLGALAVWNRKSKFLSKMLDWILNLKKPRWYACDNHFVEHRHEVLATPFLFGRWSGHVSRYSLLSYCMKKRPTRVHKVRNCLHRCIEKIIHSLGVGNLIQKLATVFFKVSQLAHVDKFLHFLGSTKDIVISGLSPAELWEGIRFVSHEPLTKEVWEFIFNELREKSRLVNNPEAAMKISSARGESILKERERDYCSSLLPYVSKVTYDESILVWHIATELLYQSDHEVSNDTYRDCAISKVLSDYMLYLLIIQPSVISTVTGIAKTRFRYTCADIIQFLKSVELKTKQEKEVCEKILALNPYELKKEAKRLDTGSTSVLVDACIVANELKKIDDLEEGKKEDKWKLMSKIWVEMLSYAASSSGSRVHAQQVNRGGELITFVWLLMAHFGLQQQFQSITPQEDET